MQVFLLGVDYETALRSCLVSCRIIRVVGLVVGWDDGIGIDCYSDPHR